MDKLLSIIIPTYNAEKFLDKGLPTYIMKDEPELMEQLEVLVVNDGTPDNSVAVAQKYVDQYPNVFRIINKENGGHGSAINEGVKHVTGKFFKVVDADDWVETEALKHFMKILKRSKADVLGSSFHTYDIEKKEYVPRDVINPSKNKEKLYNLKELMAIWDEAYHGLTFHGITYNTEFYRKQDYQLTEHVFYEDQEYATIPASRAERIQLCEEELYVYRIGDVSQSINAENQLKKLPDFHKVIMSLLDFEKYTPTLPKGGREYWSKKTSMFIASYYQIALIKSADKKAYRQEVIDFNKEIAKASPYMYECVKNKHKVFVLLNRLHMNNDFYDDQFSKALKVVKKTLHVDKKFYK